MLDSRYCSKKSIDLHGLGALPQIDVEFVRRGLNAGTDIMADVGALVVQPGWRRVQAHTGRQGVNHVVSPYALTVFHDDGAENLTSTWPTHSPIKKSRLIAPEFNEIVEKLWHGRIWQWSRGGAVAAR
jgi:hypothetical protein